MYLSKDETKNRKEETTMETTAKASERKGIIAMLSALLEKVRKHDAIVSEAKSKQREIDKVTAEINKPMKKIHPVLFIFLLLMMFIGWIILLVMTLVKKSKFKKLQAELMAQREALEAEKQAILDKLAAYDAEELEPYINSIVPDQFAARYCMNAYAIETMMNLAIDLRGDTIKEIINLYEEVSHRARLESALARVASSTEATAYATARTAAASERAAAASEATAVSTASIAVSSAATAAATRRMAANPTSVDVKVDNTITFQ